jgi:hypothetical protein
VVEYDKEDRDKRERIRFEETLEMERIVREEWEMGRQVIESDIRRRNMGRGRWIGGNLTIKKRELCYLTLNESNWVSQLL